MFKPKLFLAICALAPLAACSPKLEADVYLSDIVEAASSSERFFVPLTLKIPQASDQTCIDNADALYDAVATAFEVKKKGLCIKEGFDNFSKFDLEVPIIPGEDRQKPGFEFPAIYFVVVDKQLEDAEVFSIGLGLADPMMSTVEAVKAQNAAFRYASPVDEPIIEISLQNDLRIPVEVSDLIAFVDSVPDVGGEIYRLDRRETLEIKLSDVLSASIASGNGAYLVATVTIESE